MHLYSLTGVGRLPSTSRRTSAAVLPCSWRLPRPSSVVGGGCLNPGDGVKPRLPFDPALPAIGALTAAKADCAGGAAGAAMASDGALRDAGGLGDGDRGAGMFGDRGGAVGSTDADRGALASPLARGEGCRSLSSALELPRDRRPGANAPATPA